MAKIVQSQHVDRILRLPEVVEVTGLSRSSIYRLIGIDEFPRQRRLGPRSSGWRMSDVEQWLASREPATAAADDRGAA